MSVKIYGFRFDLTHENQEIDSILDLLHKKYDLRTDYVYVLVNFLLSGKQIDLTIIKKNAIIVVDLKNFSSPFIATENGEWSTIDKKAAVKSAGYVNPYWQIKNYRGKWANLLTNIHLNTPYIEGVEGVVCICPKYLSETINLIPDSVRWFHLVGLADFVQTIDQISNPEMNLTENDIREIIKDRGLPALNDIILDKQFKVPFYRSPKFVGREDDLAYINSLFFLDSKSTNRVVVISGMGGVGKTQLAVEYAYQNKACFSDGIYWINAKNELIDEFSKIAEIMELKAGGGSESNRKVKLARAFVERIANCQNALLIYDNLDNPRSLFRPLDTYILAQFKCYSLVTTQMKDTNLLVRYFDLKPIDERASLHLLLDMAERQNLFLKYEGDNFSDDPEIMAARKICKQLGDLPLALALSAAYLNKFPYITLQDFSKRLEIEGKLTLDKLQVDPAYLPTYHDAIISLTLKNQWNSIRTLSSRNFMRALSLFEENSWISQELVGMLLGVKDNEKLGYPDLMDQIIKELMDLSLIEIASLNKLRLHPLIKAFVEKKISNKGNFILNYAQQLTSYYSNFDKLNTSLITRGVDEVLFDMDEIEKILEKHHVKSSGLDSKIVGLNRILEIERYNLRDWDPNALPGFGLQQIFNQAQELTEKTIIEWIKSYLNSNHISWLREGYRVNPETAGLLKVLKGHKGVVTDLVMLPGENILISSSFNGEIKYWDIKNGNNLRTIFCNSFEIDAMTITSDRKYAVLLNFGFDEYKDKELVRHVGPSIAVWNLNRGEENYRLTEEQDNINGVHAVLGDQELMIVQKDNALTILALDSKSEFHKLVGHSSLIVDISIDRSNRRAVTASIDGKLIIWDLLSGDELIVLNGFPAQVIKTQFSPDGKYLAAVLKNQGESNMSLWDITTPGFDRNIDNYVGHICLWNVESGNREVSFRLNHWLNANEQTRDLFRKMLDAQLISFSGRFKKWPYNAPFCFSKNGNTIIYRSVDEFFGLLDIKEKKIVGHFREGSLVSDIVVSSDGQFVIFGLDEDSVAGSRPIKIWLPQQDQTLNIAAHEESVNALAMTSDENYLASASNDEIKIWDLTALITETVEKESNGNYELFISYDSRKILTRSIEGKKFNIFDPDSGEVLNTIPSMNENEYPRIKYISHFSDQVVIIGDNIRLYNYLTGQIDMVFPKPENIYEPQIGELIQGEILLIYQTDFENPVARVLNLNSGVELYKFDGEFREVFSTRNGGLLVDTQPDGSITLFDLESYEELQTLSGHGSSLKCAVVTYDGDVLFSGYQDGLVKIWNLSTGDGKVLYTETTEVSDITCSNDGSSIAYFVKELGAVKVWNTRTGLNTGMIKGNFTKLEMSPNGNFIAALDRFGLLHVLHCENMSDLLS